MTEIRKGRLNRIASFDVADDDNLSGVSLLSAGEALGHDLEIDEESLKSAIKALRGKKRIKAYVHHDQHSDRLGTEAGYFEGVKIVQDRVMAERFVWFASFKTHAPREYAAIMELAREMPEDFGISLSFAYSVEPGKSDKDLPKVRFREIFSADFVDQPAANPRGLFRVEQPQPTPNNMDNTDTAKELLALQKRVADLETERDNLKTALSNKDAAINTADEQRKAELKDQRDNIAAIFELGKEHGKEDLALAAVKEGKGVADFKAALLDAYRETTFRKSGGTPSPVDFDKEPANREEFAAAFDALKAKDNARATAYFQKHYRKYALV